MKIVTAKELGQYLKLSESTIYKLAGNGEIPGFRLGDSWRFDMEEILQTIRGAKDKQDLDTRKSILVKREAYQI